MRSKTFKKLALTVIALLAFAGSAFAVDWSGNEGFDKGTSPASQVTVDTTNFCHNLNSSDKDQQSVDNAFDAFTVPSETDPLSLHLNQSSPQTFTSLGGGTGLMKVTAGLLGLDTNTYVTGTPWTGLGYLTTLTTSTPTNLTGFIKGNGSVLSADNSSYEPAFGFSTYLDQAVKTTSNPQFANLKLTGGGGIYPSADSTTALYINKADNATHIVTIDSTNGNVGIGTTSPTQALHIYGSTTAASSATFQNTTVNSFVQNFFTVGAVNSWQYAFGNTYSSSGRYVASSMLLDAGGAGGLGLAASNATGVIKFYTNANNERMRIDSTGNVGIGTTSPASKLQLYGAPVANTGYGTLSVGGGVFGSGTGVFSGSSSGTSIAVNEVSGYAGNLLDLQVNGVSKFSVTSSGNFVSVGGAGGSAPSTNGQVKISNFDSAYGISMRKGGTGAGGYIIAADSNDNPVFKIDNLGNVGIGTTTPATALHIINTTGQLRLGYDASNYLSATVGSTGSLTLALTGTTPTFTFSQAVTTPTINAVHKTYNGTAAVADGTYTVGAALTPGVGVNGTITIKDGIITAIQQAT